MSADAFELARNSPLGPPAVGRPIVHRPVRELGSGLLLALIFGPVGLALAVGGLLMLTGWPHPGLGLLGAVELVFGLVFLWVTAGVTRDLLASRRFNRRGLVITWGLEHVDITELAGAQRVALEAAADHPLLRSLAVDCRIHTVARVRHACRRLAPDDPRRLILETLALDALEPPPWTGDDPPAPAPLYAAVIDRRVVLAHELADLDDCGDGTRWRVATAWDPEAHAAMPRLDPSALTRL